MRRLTLFLAATVLLVSAALSASAQSAIRYSYLNNGFGYTSTEREYVDCSQPFWCRLERIVFPGGSLAYKIELDFVAPKSVNIPKNVKLSLQTTDGKIVRCDQIASERSGKRAFTAADGSVFYWNRGQYLLDEADIEKMAAGVKIMEVAYNWNPDGFWQIEFRKNEFGSVLKRQLSALKLTPKPSAELGDRIADYGDRTSSLTIVSKPDQLESASFFLRYIYYKKTNDEDFELIFQLATGRSDVVLFESPVVFTLTDGTKLELLQQQEANNLLILYPDAAQLRRLMKGVRSVSWQTEDGATHSMDLSALAAPLSLQYNALLMVAPI